MCNACKECGKVYDYTQKLITAFCHGTDGKPLLILVQEKESGGQAESVHIKIRFCPWCGRNLMEDE